ncbi:zinc transporter ZupT [Mariniluteicoccus flavus]
MNLTLAFAVTTIAGLCTGLGGLAALWRGSTRARFLAASLGFSVGVMLYVSLVEMMPRAVVLTRSGPLGGWMAILCFLAGIVVVAALDRLLPHHGVAESSEPQERAGRPRTALMRTGVLTAIVIGLHNFPEGFATFLSTLHDPRFGIPIGVAIAIHNIPEGIAVAVPILHATGSRAKAVGWALASGLAEPVGALAAAVVLGPFMGDALLGAAYAAVAGIMVHISFDELLPTAREHGNHDVVVRAVVLGMLVMAVSLQLAG